MRALSRLWTGAIAYVSLLVGAGLSIMYNILDTMQVRGPAFDWADLITAIAAPGIVVLMVEMFVSRIWLGSARHVQIIRWMATVAIGGVAMRTSWTHGHDWMASRGQATDVATLWPLAIDLLAILATALILAGRRGHMATGQNDVATDPGHPDVAMATQPDDPTLDLAMATAINDWHAGYDEAWETAGEELATEAQTFLATTLTPPVAEKVPDDARDLIVRMVGLGAAPKEIDEAVMALSSTSARTARRWRGAVRKSLPKGGE